MNKTLEMHIGKNNPHELITLLHHSFGRTFQMKLSMKYLNLSIVIEYMKLFQH